MIPTIQQVVIDDDKSIYIKDYDPVTKELVFRTSLEPRQLHKEKVTFDGDLVYTNLYHFHVQCLYKFVHENS